MRHIASVSFGKDSLAMVLMLIDMEKVFEHEKECGK